VDACCHSEPFAQPVLEQSEVLKGKLREESISSAVEKFFGLRPQNDTLSPAWRRGLLTCLTYAVGYGKMCIDKGLSDMKITRDGVLEGTGQGDMRPSYQMEPHESPADQTDELLISRCHSGDMTAFGSLVEKYQHRLFNAVLRMVNNFDDAQELTQEAFVRALKGLKKFRGQAGFYTWLFRIGFNLCINYRRKQQPVSFSTFQSPREVGGRQAEGLLEMVDSGSPQPKRQVQISEEHRRVMDALGQLAPEARAVVVLRDIEELDYAQIARILDVPSGTVKSRLFRARMALRKRLLGKDGEDKE